MAQNIGLPNIGNTCFINSIINCLFASNSFRECIMPLANKPGEDLFIKQLAQVFNSIRPSVSLQFRWRYLKKFAERLAKLFGQEYKLGDQHDSLIILIKIIERINKKLNKKDLFNISCEIICQNQNQKHLQEGYLKQLQNQIFLNNALQSCKKCKKSSKYYYLTNIPLNILMHDQYNKIQDNKSYDSFVHKQNIYLLHYNSTAQKKNQYKILSYKLKSKNLYDKRMGHYVALRKRFEYQKQSREYYKFNDQKIQPVDINIDYITKFVLYEYQAQQILCKDSITNLSKNQNQDIQKVIDMRTTLKTWNQRESNKIIYYTQQSKNQKTIMPNFSQIPQLIKNFFSGSEQSKILTSLRQKLNTQKTKEYGIIFIKIKLQQIWNILQHSNSKIVFPYNEYQKSLKQQRLSKAQIQEIKRHLNYEIFFAIRPTQTNKNFYSSHEIYTNFLISYFYQDRYMATFITKLSDSNKNSKLQKKDLLYEKQFQNQDFIKQFQKIKNQCIKQFTASQLQNYIRKIFQYRYAKFSHYQHPDYNQSQKKYLIKKYLIQICEEILLCFKQYMNIK